MAQSVQPSNVGTTKPSNINVIKTTEPVVGQILATAARGLLASGSESQPNVNPKFAPGLNAILASAAATTLSPPHQTRTESGIVAPALIRISHPIPPSQHTPVPPPISNAGCLLTSKGPVAQKNTSGNPAAPQPPNNVVNSPENILSSVKRVTTAKRPRTNNNKVVHTKRVKKIPRCAKCIAAGKVRYTCKECGGTGICKHGRKKHYCKPCGGSQVCKHGRRKSNCKFCGGGSLCKHGRSKIKCRECGGSQICQHSRVRSQCKDCGGSQICVHRRRRDYCKECGGSQICVHGRQRGHCKECHGSQICPHARQKGKCKQCRTAQKVSATTLVPAAANIAATNLTRTNIMAANLNMAAANLARTNIAATNMANMAAMNMAAVSPNAATNASSANATMTANAANAAMAAVAAANAAATAAGIVMNI